MLLSGYDQYNVTLTSTDPGTTKMGLNGCHGIFYKFVNDFLCVCLL